MNFLIIGGNGFIGSHLIDCLLKNKHNVRVFDMNHEKYRKPIKSVDYRISNLGNIPDLWEALFDIDIVVHLACTSVPSTSNIDILSDIDGNLTTTINILKLIVRQGIKKFIFFSSGGAVYGHTGDIPIHENHPLNPISSYAIVKSTIEHYINLFHIQHNLDFLIIRPSNPFGPRQGHYNAQGVISTFLKKAFFNEPLSIFGDGNSKKDYIYIDDFINLFYDLIQHNASGVFNIGSGYGTSLNQIVDLIETITKQKQRINYFDAKTYDVNNFVLDNTKLKEFLKIGSFNLSLKHGIESTWNWMTSIL
jgi:UDP-glucose 4-epimerase